MAFIAETSRDGLLCREFDIARGGRQVPGVLWQPADMAAGPPLVCCGHGASGDRHQRPIPWLAAELAGRHGCAVLSIDGPVHGRRQQGPGGREAFWPEFNRDGSVEDMTADDIKQYIRYIADRRLTQISAAAEGIHVPVLFIMQLEDELFTREQSLALFDALASADKRLHANPGLHPEVPTEELHHSVAFLAAHLHGRAAPREIAFGSAS